MSKLILHQNLPINWNKREVLRDKGQFWTPNWVANAMVAYVLNDSDLVFDPATGRGAFFEAFLKLKKNKVNFFGTDIDNEVLDDEIYKNNKCKVLIQDFIKNPPQRKFKSIVANPPYIRHHRINNETKLILSKLSSKITGFKIDGRAGYHIYFFIQALNLLEKNGRLAFIMPADTCEGTFSKKLWKWISEKFCIEAVVTFEEVATPFPNVDTNAIIFFIKNSKPNENIYWVKSKESYTNDLLEFVSSDFNSTNLHSLEITQRQLNEAINTGLSRPKQVNNFKYHLYDFARVMRGIATGSNEFFFLTSNQVKEFRIPDNFLKLAIGRTRDAQGNILNNSDIQKLDLSGRPTLLLAIDIEDKLPESVLNYLRIGEKMGLPNLSLLKQRKPWYKMEKREIPPLLFAYLGRRSTRFILNEAGALPLTGFLCVYPKFNDLNYIKNLWQALNHTDTLENLKLVGKSYGSGAIKVEPGKLNELPIPDHIVHQFQLKQLYNIFKEQLELFRELKKKYTV